MEQERPQRTRRQRHVACFLFAAGERVESRVRVDLLGFVRKQHGVPIEGDSHDVIPGVGSRAFDHGRGGHTVVERQLDIVVVGREEQIRTEACRIAVAWRGARKCGARDRQLVVADRSKHPQPRIGTVRRHQDDLYLSAPTRIQCQ